MALRGAAGEGKTKHLTIQGAPVGGTHTGHVKMLILIPIEASKNSQLMNRTGRGLFHKSIFSGEKQKKKIPLHEETQQHLAIKIFPTLNNVL